MPVPATHSRVAAARAIVRTVYALSRHVRLFGPSHQRTLSQAELSFTRIRGFIPSTAISIALIEDRLSVDGIVLESTPAEQSFARLLREMPHQQFVFDDGFQRATLEDFASAMAFQQPNSPSATTPKEEVRKADSRSWLRNPFALLSFLNTALHDSEARVAVDAPMGSADIAPLLHVLRQLATGEDETTARGAARDLERVSASLLRMLREILLELSEIAPPPTGESLLLHTADRAVLRLVLGRLQSEQNTPAQSSALLDRLARQLHTLRLVISGAEPLARTDTTLDALTESLDRELWTALPEQDILAVLLSGEAYVVPAAAIDFHIARLIENDEDLVAAKVLENYGAAVSGRDSEGRRRSAKGIADLAELYAVGVPEYVPALVRAISLQLMRESDLRMQSLLGTALVRISYAVQQQRDFAATAAASDALEEILDRRPALGTELRPRISVENRLPEYLDEALSSSHPEDDLIGLLRRHASPVTQQLCARFMQCGLREESLRLMNLAGRLGAEARAELLRRLRTGSSEDALSAAGLGSVLLPEETSVLLVRRAAHWTQTQQDLLVRQLAMAGSTIRASILLQLLPTLDGLIVPEAIDEIGISEDISASGVLVDVATAGDTSRFSGYTRVKAIEALGRLHNSHATDALLELLQGRRILHWLQPHEVRIAALQALYMMDPDKATSLTPRSGITARELSIGPLAIDLNNPWSRQRRYSRIFPSKPLSAVASSTTGRAGLEITSLSLGGGRARRQGATQSVSDLAVQLQFALRRLNSQVLIRKQAGSELSFEIAEIGLADRSRLRHLLLAQSPAPRAA